MIFEVLLGLIASICAGGAQNLTTFRGLTWPYDIITPFPFPTPSPVNFDSKSARLISTPTPLQVTVGLYESHVITNTGSSVLVTVGRPVLTTLTGGVLGSAVYVFEQLSYHWSENYKSPAASNIDGDLTPLFVQAVFRNIKYANVAIANTFRDGYAIVQTNIKVEGYAPNLQFEQLGNILRYLRIAGSSLLVQSLPLFAWFDDLTLDKYYAYPGSVSLGPTGTQFYSATILQLPKTFGPSISIAQFQYFLNLRNLAGTPFTNKLPAFPAGLRPIVQVCGVRQVFLPTVL